MINVLKVILVSAGLCLATNAGTINTIPTDNGQLHLEELYVCSFWPTCRDPDQQKPADTSSPKPSGGKDTTKDNKDETRLS
jgi:hypothetical protein